MVPLPTDRSASTWDRPILSVTRAARGFGAGALSVVLAIDLGRASYSPLLVGALLALAMAGASAWSILVPRAERWIGRRSLFGVGAVALAAGGTLLWYDLASLAVVVVALLLGGIVAGSADISPLGALEQASLADAASDRHRTRTFSFYNLAGYIGTALGALAAGPLSQVGSPFGTSAGSAPRDAVMLLYALIGVGLVPAYFALSRPRDTGAVVPARPPIDEATRSIVRSLSGLFAIDAFGGGLIANTLVAYYLEIRFAPSLESLGLLFFAASLAAAFSLMAAVPLARRFGLVNTMVFTHIPSSILLIMFAFGPTFLVASLFWIARSTLSQMDVPTRQSYTQAVVPPGARATAAGYTTAARSAQLLGAPVTGALLGFGGPWLAGPFLLAGSVKIAYDLALYRRFRWIRPPEEIGRSG